ncbi:unnamed protein product, partial [Musa textilis]
MCNLIGSIQVGLHSPSSKRQVDKGPVARLVDHSTVLMLTHHFQAFKPVSDRLFKFHRNSTNWFMTQSSIFFVFQNFALSVCLIFWFPVHLQFDWKSKLILLIERRMRQKFVCMVWMIDHPAP